MCMGLSMGLPLPPAGGDGTPAGAAFVAQLGLELRSKILEYNMLYK